MADEFAVHASFGDLTTPAALDLPLDLPAAASTAGAFAGTAAWFLAICLMLAIVGLIVTAAGLMAHVSNDYGEGFNAYWAAAAMQGPHFLYSPAHVMIANNYPPLSFYLVGALGRLTGDNVIAGRIVALAAMTATAVLSGWVVGLLGAPTRWRWITGALLLTYAGHVFGRFVAVDNPQWLAQAVMLAGVIPLIRKPGGPGLVDCLASAALMVLAVLIKHNLFAFPLASAIWLAVYHRGALARWLLGGAVLSALAVATLYAIYGNAVFVEIIAFDRTVDWRNFREGLTKVTCFMPMLLVTAALARRPDRDNRWELFAIAGVGGVVLGAIQRLGAGVSINAHFDALIALVIVAGFAFGSPEATWRQRFASAKWQTALLLALLIPAIKPLPGHIGMWARQFSQLRQTQNDWDHTIADVHNTRGMALCEIPAVCFWAGKPFAVDFFAFGQKYRRSHQPLQLYDWINSRAVGTLIIEKDYLTDGREPRIPAPFPDLIARNYRTVRVIAPGDINEMVPRMQALAAGAQRKAALPAG